LVSRPALLERLDQGLHLRRRLSLISAPAGYGKTTLVTEWLSTLTRRGLKIAWLSLDERDNHLQTFLIYLCTAFQQVQPGLGSRTLSLFDLPQVPPIANVLTSLINELATSPADSQIVLILDDYHLITELPIHEGLAFLIDHFPPNLHLVIATRKDPLLPLARLRARGQLTEIRMAALRFNSSEAMHLFNHSMALDLNSTQVEALVERTEGWVAGLQLAAISLDNQPDVDAFIRSFSGSDRHLMDYLVEEVLSRQPEEIQTFLLRTSILKRLCAELCDVLVENRERKIENGQGIQTDFRSPWPAGQDRPFSSSYVLDYLERSNLFLVPLDSERTWYRYHPLFIELLQRRLQFAVGTAVVRELKQRASRWFAEHGYLQDAIEYALSAQDLDQAADLIEIHGIAMMTESGRGLPAAWFNALPREIIYSRPMLAIISALALFDRQPDPPELIDQYLDELEAQWDGRTGPYKGYLYALRSATARLRGVPPEELLAISEKALENLPDEDYLFRWQALRGQFTAYLAQARIDRAEKILEEALLLNLLNDDIFNACGTYYTQAYTATKQGDLARAIAILKEGQTTVDEFERGGRYIAVAGALDVLLAKIAMEQDNLSLAEEMINCCGMERLKFTNEIFTIMRAQVYMAWIRTFERRYAEAQPILDMARKSWSGAATYTRSAQIRMLLFQAQDQPELLAEAIRYSQEIHLDTSENPKMRSIVLDGEWYYVEQIAVIRLLIALRLQQGLDERFEEARQALEVQLRIAEECGWGERVIELLILKALAAHAEGSSLAGLPFLERALPLAAQQGYIRMLTNEGQPMVELLSMLRSQKGGAPVVSMIDQFLLHFSTPQSTDLPNTADCSCSPVITVPRPFPIAGPPAVVDPLTEREIEVLRWISSGLSNLEIASRLCVAESTIKKHINHIYDKLGVKTRTQALVRAREREII